MSTHLTRQNVRIILRVFEGSGDRIAFGLWKQSCMLAGHMKYAEEWEWQVNQPRGCLGIGCWQCALTETRNLRLSTWAQTHSTRRVLR
jgi:hypothetical protein